MDEEAARCITDALTGSPYPLTAPEIAKKIPGWTKKKVNQHIFKMGRTVEQIPGTQPPKWKLIDGATIPTPPQVEQTQQEGATGTSAPSVCSSTSISPVTTPTQASSDEDIKQEVIRYLQAQSSPVSAPNVSSSISSKLKCETATIKRILYELQTEAVVSNLSPKGQKPLWEMKRARPKAKTLNGNPLYAKEEDENGVMKLIPVTQDHLNDHDPPSSNSKPAVIENTPTKKEDEIGVAKLTPVTQDLLNDQSDPPSSNSKPAVIENTPTKKRPPENMSTAAGDERVEESGPGTRSVPVKLAARFDALTVEDKDSDDVLRQKVLDFLKYHPDNKLSTITRSIGCPTRDKVLYILECLKKEDKVEETNDSQFKLI